MGVNLSTASPLPDDATLQNYNGSWREYGVTLLHSYTPNNEESKEFSLSPGFDFYLVKGWIKPNNTLKLTYNSLNSGYAYLKVTSTNTLSTNQSSIILTPLGDTYGYNIDFKLTPYGNLTGMCGGNGSYTIAGYNTNIEVLTSIKIGVDSGKVLGTLGNIKVYGCNYV